jgi:signal transduction histidine kinase
LDFELILRPSTTLADLEASTVLVDEHKIAQVVRNLVSNALKFTPSGGKVTVTAGLGWSENVNGSKCSTGDNHTSGTSGTSGRGFQGDKAAGMKVVIVDVIDDGAGISEVRLSIVLARNRMPILFIDRIS